MEDDSDDDRDVDSLSPAVLEARYDGTVEVGSWCTSDQCSTATLIQSMEYRCCREVVHAVGKLTFNGSIKRAKCITQHEDYAALINRTEQKMAELSTTLPIVLKVFSVSPDCVLLV